MTFPVHNLARRAAVKNIIYAVEGPSFQLRPETSSVYTMRIRCVLHDAAAISGAHLSQPYKTLGEP